MAQNQIIKTCSICHEIKSYRDFSILKDGSIQAKCRKCNNLQQKLKSNDTLRNHQVKTRRKWAYGLTDERFNQIVEDQEGLCPICRQPLVLTRAKARSGQSGFMLGAQIEHDHKTGLVRSLMCGRCNAALGMLKDNPMAALRAYQYLKKFADHEYSTSLEEIES